MTCSYLTEAGQRTHANILRGSDLAAVSDGNGFDYVFFQDAGGYISRALYNGQYSNGVQRYAIGQLRTKLSAAYVSAKRVALLLYQAREDPASILFELVENKGTVAYTGNVTCGHSC